MSRAFLIGAGVTTAEYPNAPLSANFFKLLKRDHPAYFVEIDQAIHQCLGSTPAALEEFNVEEVMIMSEKFPLSNRASFLANLHAAIYELLVTQTQSTREFILGYIVGRYRRPQTLLKTLLVDPRFEKNDFFMTLNYDLYLDREVLSIEGRIDYGIENKYIAALKEIKLLEEQHYSVYHLHGSLNWEDHINQVTINIGAILPRYTRSGSNLCLVPPGKKDLTPVLKSIWETAERRLFASDELIIIGCSLNPTDTELIQLIKKFTDKKGCENVKVIYLDKMVDPTIEIVTDNYTRTIGSDIKRYNHGFFLNSPDVRSGVSGAIEFIFTPISEIKLPKHPDH